jgi:hypothetical protein
MNPEDSSTPTEDRRQGSDVVPVSEPVHRALPERLAVAIFEAAIAEGRAAEVLEVLIDGGSVTLDAATHRLIVVPAQALEP